jgi:hypothetical protein
LKAVKELEEWWVEETMAASAFHTFVRFSLEKTIPSELNLMTKAEKKRNVKPQAKKIKTNQTCRNRRGTSCRPVECRTSAYKSRHNLMRIHVTIIMVHHSVMNNTATTTTNCMVINKEKRPEHGQQTCRPKPKTANEARTYMAR